MVAWAATVKFGKRSTAKIAVKPMAGTARIVPAINPLRRSWSASANFQELELPLLGQLVAELAVEDVADLGAVGLALGLSEGEHDEARLIVGLTRIRIDVVGAEHLGQPLVRVRLR